MLALHEMVEAGHQPAALLVMYRQEAGRSWVHGIEPKLLAAIGEALEIPLICCNAKSETYDEDMQRDLRQARELGVVDGPLFRRPVPTENRGLVLLDQITAADLVLAGEK